MHPDDDPYADDDSGRVFWADAAADRVLARDPEEPIVVKGGISPSGVPHLGNMNEIVRGYFVAEALRERGHEVRQVFTSDDRDPLRGLPRKLADLDGEVVDLGDVNAGALGQNLGAPYTAIPDPFGCCDSYGAHFSNLIQSSADLLGVDVEMVSNTETYEDGDFEAVTRFLLEHVDEARDVLAEYQDKVDEDYVPFNPVCEECGKVTETVTGFDAEAGTVDYVCTDMDAGDQTIEGCGHEGTATLRGGKLPWRFEWPAQWRVLGVDFEPFGKDHAEGSWPSGADVARNVLGDEPPVPMAYEWFTLDGEPFSSSAGHVVLVQDVLELLEPAVVRLFFSKDPRRSRDFAIEHLDQLVDEFDRMERVYFDEVDADEDERERAERVYPFLVDEIDPDRVRIPYTFAAVLGMTDDPDLREEIARREGHIPEDADEATVEAALSRVRLAREWARRTDNEFNYDLKRTEIPAHDFDDATAAALDDLADYLEAEDPDAEALQGEVYESAKRHDVDIGAFFSAGYRLFFDESQGPKLGPFLAKLDRQFVLDRLRREA
ncbi:lysine--tRNA ligase [Halobacterium jilantaiense]|uniref:Lysine--tRNA ligase n=1 Tax=Halobacterium jilantaiense TaxID=355548 RepID=A0A1I0Q4Y3_9EURY|nr:lysine--tRNA ligase [Halobacterium jilantaiense]SEW21954.1 lysyl-tRNA synthetase, class I [Halobacterium jilantaiense]